MKQVNAYRCEHCGKLYLSERACIEHENNLCLKNPQIRPLCYDCMSYRPADYNTETIEVYYDNAYDGSETAAPKEFSPHKCAISGCKLYHNVKLSEEMQVALDEANYAPMPNLRNGGCGGFEKFEANEHNRRVERESHLPQPDSRAYDCKDVALALLKHPRRDMIVERMGMYDKDKSPHDNCVALLRECMSNCIRRDELRKLLNE